MDFQRYTRTSVSPWQLQLQWQIPQTKTWIWHGFSSVTSCCQKPSYVKYVEHICGKIQEVETFTEHVTQWTAASSSPERILKTSCHFGIVHIKDTHEKQYLLFDSHHQLAQQQNFASWGRGKRKVPKSSPSSLWISKLGLCNISQKNLEKIQH